MDRLCFEDYNYYPTYHHGITGWWMHWEKSLKQEKLIELLHPSPIIVKIENGVLIETSCELFLDEPIIEMEVI